jgi:hypothetical protein
MNESPREPLAGKCRHGGRRAEEPGRQSPDAGRSSMIPEKLPGLFDSGMLRHFDIELRPYRSNGFI